MTDRGHLKFEFLPETSGGSPSQEKRLIGYKDICPKSNHGFFLPGTLVTREEGIPDEGQHRESGGFRIIEKMIQDLVHCM